MTNVRENLKALLDSLEESEILNIGQELLSIWASHSFPVKNEERQKVLRPEIIKRIAASFLTDDERASFFDLPNGCRIREGGKIISPEKLVIGEHCWIGEGAILDASGHLEIGSHTSIGLNVMIWTHDSHRLNLKGQNTPDKRDQIRRRKTKIGSRCFIAGPSVVMPGVTIGDSCVVAPGSIVYSDIPDHTLYQPYKDMLAATQRLNKLELELDELKKLCGK